MYLRVQYVRKGTLGLCFYRMLSELVYPKQQESSKILNKRKPTLFVPGHQGHDVYQIVKPFIDIDYINKNAKEIKKSCELRNMNVELDLLPEISLRYGEIKGCLNVLESKHNKYLDELRRLHGLNQTKEYDELTAEHVEFCEELRKVKCELYDLEETAMPLFHSLPNLVNASTPIASNLYQNYFDKPAFPFCIQSHKCIGKVMNCLDFSDTIPTAYYLRGILCFLDLAIQDFFFHHLNESGFNYISCMDFCKSFVIEACGKDPYSNDDCIPLKNRGGVSGQRLNLVGSATFETYCAYLTNMKINKMCLPMKYFNIGCYYNAEQSNIDYDCLFNVMQSTKVQFTQLSEQSTVDDHFEEISKLLLSLYMQLQIPFREVKVSANDLKVTESRRTQFELWSPYFQKYVFCGDVSQHDDFISKRLQMTFGNETKVEGYLHVVEGTAATLPVILACIMENQQNKEGKFSVPEVLRKFMID